ncbi:MAG: single-stranded DNA-binding protein [Halothiobacillus sp.]|nr:single-stranded DNA-binding protein [Halothiobacillus sp.]
MSSYINRAQLQGVVGNDPELRYVGESGKAVCNVRLATTNHYKTAQGEYSEETEWHTVVGWEAVAERMAQLNKGDWAAIEGRIRTRTAKDAKGTERTHREIICERVTRVDVLRAKTRADSAPNQAAEKPPRASEQARTDESWGGFVY